MVQLSVIIVGIEHPGNLGAVARAMKNFGAARLILIEPKCSPADEEARNRAKWANDLLEKAESFSSLDDLDLDMLVATTAELGNDFNLPRSPVTPRQLFERLAELSEDSSVGVVFGRESDGLSNEEIAACDFTLSIPANPDYPVLNLSHAVAVSLYALTVDKYAEPLEVRFPLVKKAEKAQLQKQILETIDSFDWQTTEKQEIQRILWKRLVGKSFLTQREAMALLGFFKKAKNI